jgi:hypothetical protein
MLSSVFKYFVHILFDFPSSTYNASNMMLSSLSKRMALLAIIAIASAGTSLHAEKALVVFEPSALTPVEPWDGSTAIEPRANTALVVAFIGGGFLLTSNAVTNTCTLAIAAGNLPLCAAAIAAAATGAAIAFLAAYAGGHQPDKREEDQFLWRYPMLDSGPPMKDQVMAAFAGGDGSPVFMGTSGSEQFTNHDLWYSNTFNLTGRGKYVHRVHATPVKSDDPGRRKRTLLERQSGSEQATEQGYTGGYVWEVSAHPGTRSSTESRF